MSPKRGDRVAPPPGTGEWDVRFLDNESAKGWEDLCRQAPGNTRDAWHAMRHNPTPPTDSPRHHRLRYQFATGQAKGRVLDHWQIEVTGGGRIWYLVDAENTTIWIDYAGPAHPRGTD
ncbi:MAG: hypothetical protein ACRDN0_39285 [Trebonia sp.]